MRIKVQRLTGQTLEVELERDSSVKQLKVQAISRNLETITTDDEWLKILAAIAEAIPTKQL